MVGGGYIFLFLKNKNFWVYDMNILNENILYKLI